MDELDSTQTEGTTQGSKDGGQPGSIDAVQLQSLIEGLSNRLAEVDARTKALQGDKDRSVQQTKREVSELRTKIDEIERLKGTGLGLDAAIEEVNFRDEVRSLKQKLADYTPANEAAANIARKLNLDPNSAEFTALSARFTDPVELAMEAGKLSGSRASVPNGAGVAPLPNNAPPPPQQDDAALKREYIEKMNKAKGNRSLVDSLMKEYGQKGVKTWEISF